MRTFHPLAEQRLNGAVFVARPAPPRPVTAESPAADVMTDLRHTHTATISPQTSMETAHAYMVQRGVRMLLVAAPDHSLTGIVTSTDVMGEKPLRVSEERRIKHSEILVSDVMSSLDKLGAILLADLSTAKVGDVIASLRESGRQHTLVMDNNTRGENEIVGIFSITQIERQMGAAIESNGVATTFAELEAALVAT